MSPRELLWADSEVYHRRLEKSGIALIAVARALSSDRELISGIDESLIDEFLRLYEWVTRADPDHFTQVWRDPGAYFWIRRAVHFLASCRGEPLGTVEREYCTEIGASSPREALAHHIREFKQFALALGIVSGQTVTFSEPYEAALPLAIPGTPFVVIGDTRATIAGFSNGAIEVLNPQRLLPISNTGSTASSGLRVEVCPTVTCDNVSVFLNPATFHIPGIGIPNRWTQLPLAFQFEHAGLVADALSAIRRFQPWTFSHLAAGLRIIALKPYDQILVNVTASELPGAFVCTVPSDPYVLASSFIHEFHHNTLFGIEERGRFFEPSDQDEIEGENHYSPWVETLRPLHGILHAIYVFIPVFRYWSAIARDGSLSEAQLGFAREQLAQIPAQLQIGVNQLRRHARFTPFGSMLMDELEADAKEAYDEARTMGLTLKTPVIGVTTSGALRPLLRAGRQVTVGETLLEHLEASDVLGECAAEKAMLTAAMNGSELTG
jgi:HEXXH motif-containing protein